MSKKPISSGWVPAGTELIGLGLKQNSTIGTTITIMGITTEIIMMAIMATITESITTSTMENIKVDTAAAAMVGSTEGAVGMVEATAAAGSSN